METQPLLEKIIHLAEEFKAEDIKVIDVKEVCSFADYFAIFSGTSSKQLQALGEEIILQCKHAGRKALSVEGLQKGEWVLIDYGDVLIHLFDPEKRAFYAIEELWQEGKVVFPPTFEDLDPEVGAEPTADTPGE